MNHLHRLALVLCVVAVGVVSCKANMTGTWKGKCTIAGKEDSAEKECTVEVTDTEMTLTVPGYVQCGGTLAKYGDRAVVSSPKCTVADKKGKATKGKQGCDKLKFDSSGLDLVQAGDDATMPERRIDTGSDDTICLPGTNPDDVMGNSFAWFTLSAKTLKK